MLVASGNKTLLEVSLESNSKESVDLMDDLAFKALNWGRQVYPGFRPKLMGKLPDEVIRPVLALADQLFGGIQVAKDKPKLSNSPKHRKGMDLDILRLLEGKKGLTVRCRICILTTRSWPLEESRQRFSR